MKLPFDENKATTGHPDTRVDFESSLCRPTAKITMESSARSPPATSINLVLCTRLPTIPSNPPITTRTRAAHPYQMSIVTCRDTPSAAAVAWYGYIDTPPEKLNPLVPDTVIVHQGNAKLMNAIMPPTMPMMFGFKYFLPLRRCISRQGHIYFSSI